MIGKRESFVDIDIVLVQKLNTTSMPMGSAITRISNNKVGDNIV